MACWGIERRNMLATTNDVKIITGKSVSAQLVQRAQYVIESYIGKLEVDITNARDIELSKRAVAYQSAYMEGNEDLVFEQMSVSTTGQNDAYTTFKNGDSLSPFISPLSILTCHKLTFFRSRSVKTGRYDNSMSFPDWTTV